MYRIENFPVGGRIAIEKGILFGHLRVGDPAMQGLANHLLPKASPSIGNVRLACHQDLGLGRWDQGCGRRAENEPQGMIDTLHESAVVC